MRFLAFLICFMTFTAMGDDLPASMQMVLKQGGSVVKSFPAPDGLTGWVVKINGHSFVVYTTPSGGYLVSGSLFDGSGRNLTPQYVDMYVPKPDPEKTAATLNSDTWLIDEGKAGAPLIYAYLDPNCSFCNKFWTELRPYIADGKVHVRWAIVSFLKDTSQGKAAAILAAPNKVKALAENETRFDHEHEEGGIPELRPVSQDIQTVLAMHTVQMNESGDQGTPTILIHHKNGWMFSYGAPPDIQKFIDDINKP